ncbi:flagellar hook-associated protein FlgK [Vibrio mediterranei]|uniref:flagellar hook-associated protein FlgK n=1 Tax=Vibrio mediterranei TaxID=689 RepID=UPI0040698AE5
MSVINIGLSGVNAFKVAMNVTALNTANANTVGYSRQAAVFGALTGGTVVGGMEVGSGVEVQGIRRIVDTTANQNLRSARNDAGYSAEMLSAMSYLEEVLNADGLNINDTLGDFFAAINQANPEPSSTALRQQILQKADLLAQSLAGTQSKIVDSIKNQIAIYETKIQTINSDLETVARLNEEIEKAVATGSDISALQDQLDVVVNRLSEEMSVNAIYGPEGTVELASKNGEPLVIGRKAATLSRDMSSGDPYSTDLTISFGNSQFSTKGSIGGALGAVSDVVTNEIQPLLATFDDIAANLADEVNAALSNGFDLNGNAGTPLFTYDPANPAQTLRITNISVDELALSSDGAPGNGDILHDIFAISEKPMAGGSHAGQTMSEAYSLRLGQVGAQTSKYVSINQANQSQLQSAQVARDSVSAVNTDEEAANLMIFMNAYNANLKVISAGNQMFESILTAF